jgi:hypothetical protein
VSRDPQDHLVPGDDAIDDALARALAVDRRARACAARFTPGAG